MPIGGAARVVKGEMFETLSLLISDTSHALGHPNREHLDPSDLTRAVFQTLAFFGLDSQHSEQLRINKVIPINLNSRDSYLNVGQEILLPSYIERKVGNEPNESWDWIPNIRLAGLEEAHQGGRGFCSFSREEEGWRLVLSYDPAGIEHRLHYYADPIVPTSKHDPLPLPSRFGFMFTAKSVMNVVPMMFNRAAKLPEEQQLTSTHLQAIESAVGHAQGVLNDWEPLWNKEKRADLNVQGRMRRPILRAR